MSIPFVDFRPQYDEVKNEVDKGVKKVFETGNFILGAEEKDFEVNFAKYCDTQYGIGVNSGTDALHLALRALDIGPGDEVIVPTFTFIASALAVSYTGATPVFADIEEGTYSLDIKKLESLITKKTKAIMPVHLYGQPANLDEILAIAKKHNLRIVEDCAQAHGALYKNKKVGSFGDIGCFSFYPTKGLGAFGDGGFIATNSEDLYNKVLMLRDYGRKGRYEHVIKGYNSRLDTVQAVVLDAKLKHFDRWNKMRNEAAVYYGKLLDQIEGVCAPVIKENRTHTFQTFAIRTKNRDIVCERMQKKGIGVLVHYPIPVHLQEAYQELEYKKGDLPVSEKIAGEILSLPMFPHIKKEQIDLVCAVLKESLFDGSGQQCGCCKE
ncbi:MAG: DegT/DnrJ/EryC1/StrS family aminotransferase [Candidatus Omnitrophica bacterium]|nr:DegT/DnrJ/EryC1/StrS family aminotransferase [Candidatus Omnitrophota bacterium]